ncbi:NADP-dependent oxidoreductase [Sphingosinicella terrae]|uniref:NADP-dependent oxidoreductase n=1 Tax=Sphingosinicella terrae TaxID=2172047 RepID=UPI0013B3D1B4|nr:NADP-dependent oxidoreductase [Sphingosinicella terrae]
MKAVRIHDYGGPEMLRVEDVADPSPGPGEVLIDVAATSVNPVDWKIRSGAAKAIVQYPMPLVLGGDVAGTIAAVGEGVSEFGVGDEVFALLGLVGAYAERIVASAEIAAPKPAGLSFAEAASLPLVALTAWQGLLGDGRDLADARILVHNAAGGVGTVAVQIAKAKGAQVVATASQKNADFVRGLGADEVVDFRQSPVSGYPQDIDLLLDLVGDQDALRLWSLVRRGGTVVRIAGGADAAALAEEGGLKIIKARVRPNGEQLREIAALVEAGKLRPVVSAMMPLEQVADAHRLSQSGHVRGKIVLTAGA